MPKIVLSILFLLLIACAAQAQDIPDMSSHGFRFLSVGEGGKPWRKMEKCAPEAFTFCVRQEPGHLNVNLVFLARDESIFTLERQRYYIFRSASSLTPLLNSLRATDRLQGEGLGKLGSGQSVFFRLIDFRVQDDETGYKGRLFLALFVFQTPTHEIFTGYVDGAYTSEHPADVARKGLAQIYLVDPALIPPVN